MGRAYNRLTHLAAQQLIWQSYRIPINRWRQTTLGLPAVPFRGLFAQLERDHFLCGFSPSFIPRPKEWGDWVQITGYWFLPDSSIWTPPPALLDFLAAGPPPVYAGFGSMADRGSGKATELVVDGLRRAGRRGVLATGGGGLHASVPGDDLFVLEAAPHAWLFPRMAAVIHHGGAGTTAAGLRAGVPSIVTPFFADQFFWGRQVAARGLGPTPIPQKQLTAAKLAAAITTATGDAQIVHNARVMGARIRAEDGVGIAVKTLEQALRR